MNKEIKTNPSGSKLERSTSHATSTDDDISLISITVRGPQEFIYWQHQQQLLFQRSISKEERIYVKRPAMVEASSSNAITGWPNGPEHYEIGEPIGVGATAVVYSAICKPRNEKCAIKRINLEKWNTSMEELLKEIQAMSSCNHENVVNYYTSFVVKDELWLVLKLLAGGSLLDLIKYRMKTSDCRNGVFDEATIAAILKEVLKGLEYFHNNGQIHRDIKAGNILLGEDGTVQIADFGVSSWLATGGDLSRQKARHTFVGTPCWMAPEVMEQVTGYDFKADIWSFGITAIELATGTAPYHRFPPMKVLMLTLQNEPPTIDTGATERDQYKNYGSKFRKMISDALQKDPKNRPTATELLKHPFFKKARDKKFLQETLLSNSPGLESRSQKAKVSGRNPHSGRLHRTEAGNWVWSSDEDSTDDEQEVYDTQRRANVINDTIKKGSEEAKAMQSLNGGIPDSDATINRGGGGGIGAYIPSDDSSPEPESISFVLRMRNKVKELNDIRFDFAPNKDTADGIASELVGAGLVDGKDMVLVAANLQKLIGQPNMKTVKFPISTTLEPLEIPDERTLVGFAQLSLAD
ncbi:serine/threonine-protein kinase OSR1-like isoform X2 [Artemia franciscana]|uniref:serine/threonine-protein kinase OSR1-like isoform X2 n=1 Tax=Artemia franciscana TaxID=6661 RepID=UPI0032DA85B2